MGKTETILGVQTGFNIEKRLLGGSVVKNPAANEGDTGSSPGL